jgi:hypothetical protein
MQYFRSGSGINTPNHISESLEKIFGFKILKFYDADADPDPESGMEKIRIRDKHLISTML